MEKSIEDTVRSYFRLVNEERFEEFFELFDLDVEFNAPFGFQTRGLENVKPFYLQVPENYPVHVDTPVEIAVSGNKAAVFIDFNGRTKSGIPVSFKATDWFTFENGKITCLNIFFDSYYLSRIIAGKRNA